MFSRERVFGWTLSSSSGSYVTRPTRREEVEAALEEARRRGLSVTPRGAGYSYGDMILNEGGVILDLNGMNRILDWNPETGRMTCEPGVTFAQALARSLPDHWLIPAVPGTRYPTLGGALSNNVHGKNGWNDGSFGDWVAEFTLLAGDGRIYRCSRDDNPEIFRAAIGGMGLLGVILEVVLQLKKIPSAYLEVRMWTVPNLEEMLEEFETLRGAADYHIGWVDCFPRGETLGRGTIHSARFVEAPKGKKGNPDLEYLSPYLLGVFPRSWLWPLIKPFFGKTLMRAVNSAKFHLDRMTGKGRPHLQNFFQFTFLLDSIPNWRQLFLPHGYLELEPLIPFGNCAGTFRELIELTQEYGNPSHLTAIKSHRGDDALLSYSLDGCSIGIDIPVAPARKEELEGLFFRMNEVVMRAGGRSYLAKDEMLSVGHFREMYPRWSEFDALKRRCDPELLFQSDMYRRLFRNGETPV